MNDAKISKPIFLFLALLFANIRSSSGQSTIQYRDNLIDKSLGFETFNLNNKTLKRIEIAESKKIVILDFWATWCLPCLENLKYMNQIKNKYKNEVDVIAVSMEPTQKIIEHLKYLHYLKTSNILFSSDTLHRSLIEYTIIPTTLIIKNGIVKYHSVGECLTLNKFDSLYNLSNTFNNQVENSPIITKKPTIASNILDYRFTNYSVQFGKSEGVPNFRIDTSTTGEQSFVAENFTLLSLYKYAYNLISVNWLQDQTKNENISAFKPDNLYTLRIYGNFADKKELFNIAQNVLAKNFTNIRTKTIKKKDSVYVLSIDTSDKKFKKIISNDTTSASSLSFFGPNFSGKNITIYNLYDYISNEVGYLMHNIAINESNYKKRINLDFNWSYASPETLSAKLSEYGIQLTKKSREFELRVLY
ncbi:MAG: hypothetical protein DI598_06440 [Pseudopedobacter saltans]|uniref:Thioredoxin domain-containing protein n=1 Tax=Pseudopedobacter saltans TaxID=151895 RepID=A0A2W5GW40_9SPHI|nr:MAG: hypothetical protein DI598_06440 [Pseudopedobacter saltans]